MARRRLMGVLGFGTGLAVASALYRRSTGRRRDRNGGPDAGSGTGFDPNGRRQSGATGTTLMRGSCERSIPHFQGTTTDQSTIIMLGDHANSL